MAGIHAGEANEELQPMERTSPGAVWEGLLWEGPYTEAGEECDE